MLPDQLVFPAQHNDTIYTCSAECHNSAKILSVVYMSAVMLSVGAIS